MLNIKKQIEVTEILLEPQIKINGSTANGTRTLSVVIPIADENGSVISAISKEYTGEEFNDVYSQFNSDKYLIKKVLEDSNIEVCVDDLPDNLEN